MITYSYQWKRDGVNIVGATSANYTITSQDLGHTITCFVTTTRNGVSTTASTNAVVPIPAPINLTAPTITGSAQSGKTVTTSKGVWNNSPASFSYQWKKNGTNISGEINNIYTIVPGDVGSNISVDVTAINKTGSSTASSNIIVPSNVIVAPVNISSPAITGSTIVTSVLSSSTGGWLNNPSSYVYQWKRNGTSIIGANSSTYTLISVDIGANITCTVTATNAGGSSSSISNSIGPISSGGTAPVNTASPIISGSTINGQILTVSNGSWSNTPTSYSYQWKRNGTNISGQTSNTYILTNTDVGTNISCTVTATNTYGSASSTSSAVGPVASSSAAMIGVNPNTQSYEYNSKFYANYWHYADGYEYQDSAGNWAPLADSYLTSNDGWPNSAPSVDPSGKYTFRKMFTPSPTPNTTLNVTWTGNIVSCGTGGSASGFTSTGSHSATFVNIPGMAGNDISPPGGGSTAAWAYFWYQITPGDASYGKNIFIAAPGVTFAEPTYVSDVGAMTSGPIRMLNPSNVNGNLGIDPGAPGQTGNATTFPAARVTAANRNTPNGGNWVPDSPGNAYNGTPHGHDGWPIEIQFGISRALGRDLWTCLQANGDNTYYDYIATWIRDYETTVQPGQSTTQPWPTGAKIYLQLANETWNTAFPYWHQANQEGLRRNAGQTINSIHAQVQLQL
jgi:hypothetical protein